MEHITKGKVDSKFRWVLLAATRAEQLMRGARPNLDLPGEKAVRLAQKELDQERLEWDYGAAPEPEPTAEPAEAPAETAEEN